MLPGHIRAPGTLYTNTCQRQGRGPPEPLPDAFLPPWPCGGLGSLLEHMSASRVLTPAVLFQSRPREDLRAEWDLLIEHILGNTGDLHKIFNCLWHLDRTKVTGSAPCPPRGWELGFSGRGFFPFDELSLHPCGS